MIRGLAQKSFKKYKMKDCESRSDERKGEFRNIHAGFMFHFAAVGTMESLLFHLHQRINFVLPFVIYLTTERVFHPKGEG